jgi:hypothetical protein
VAFTQSDLDSIKKAIAKGQLSVEIDGTKITYRSMDELMMAKTMIERDLNAGTSNECSSTLAEFCDD